MTVNVSKPVVNVREKLAELDKPTGIAGEAMLRAETPQEQFNLIGAGRRNLIINGAMQVAQRGTSFTTSSNNIYTLDRWKSQGTYDTENLTIEKSSDAPEGFGNSLKVTVSTAEGTADVDDYNIITQKLEGQNLTQLNYGSSNAATLTVSFWVKASIAQTYCVSLYQTNGNKHYSQQYTVNSANTWEYKTVFISGNTANAIAYDSSQELEVGFMLGAGTTYTSGSNGVWGGTANFAAGATHTFMTTANATWQITGVQLELGKVATPFEHRSYGEELALCQRYYSQIYYQSEGVVGLVGNVSTYSPVLPVTMRAAGTITHTNVASGGDVSGLHSSLVNHYGLNTVFVVISTSGTGYGYYLADIAIDAEL